MCFCQTVVVRKLGPFSLRITKFLKKSSLLCTLGITATVNLDTTFVVFCSQWQLAMKINLEKMHVRQHVAFGGLISPWHQLLMSRVQFLLSHVQWGRVLPRIYIIFKAQWVGVVWAEFVTTSIILVNTSKKLELSRAHTPRALSICRFLHRDRPVMLTISTSPVVGMVDGRGYDC